MDAMVLATQQWLNKTYGNDSRFNKVVEDGITGWGTIYGLRRALQIELGIENTSNNFGPTTYSLCPNVNQGEQGNIVQIIQGGLWCKGYSPTGFDGIYGNGTYVAVKLLKADMGFPTASGNMNRDIMKALLDMSAFVCLSNGSEEIRGIQQQLNYDYYDYFQICPCDGLYNRDMNKMLIYALQKELGITKNSATGTWGPTTISKCKEKTFSIGDSSKIVKLIRYALVCNGFTVSTSSSVYDSNLDEITEKFAKSLLLEKPSNAVNYTIIKSLLSSNGDTDRGALACDTATRLDQAKIDTLKNNDYRIVGRYLTKVQGGLDKNMTQEEVNLLLFNDMKIFPIFQEYGGENSAFDEDTGKQHGEKAYQVAKSLGIPFKTPIYFAVDYDPQTSDIKKFILPYFRGVYQAMKKKTKGTYRVGVYGTRNVCDILLDNNSSDLNISNLFVSDASYGFSGNLGFKMPENWDFDQFKTDITIGTGSGAINIDKVATTSVNNGFGHVDKVQSTLDGIYNTLKELFSLAMRHTKEDVLKSNLLVSQYIRSRNPSYTGSLWEITGGKLDENYAKKADLISQPMDYTFKDPLTGIDYELLHFMATLSAILYESSIPGFDLNWEVVDPLVDIFSGWGGDITTFASDLQRKVEKGDITDYKSFAYENICVNNNATSFPLEDYIGDIDAQLWKYLIHDNSIHEMFYNYFIAGNGEISKRRTNMYISNAYGNLEDFILAVNTFSKGADLPLFDPINELKAKLCDNRLPEEKYRDVATNAFISFVSSEYTSGR